MRTDGTDPWDRHRSRPRGVVGRFVRGVMIRIAATLALFVGGFVGIVLYVAFLANRFAWYQNLAIVLSAILTVPLAAVLVWVAWGVAAHRRMEEWLDDLRRPEWP